MMKRLVPLVTLALTASCGSVTSPSGAIPTVAGSYSGTAAMVFTLKHRLTTCEASTSVAQSGGALSIAPIVLAGGCGGMTVSLDQQSIDATGKLLFGDQYGISFDPGCGFLIYTASGRFYGRSLSITLDALSTTCDSFKMNATLVR